MIFACESPEKVVFISVIIMIVICIAVKKDTSLEISKVFGTEEERLIVSPFQQFACPSGVFTGDAAVVFGFFQYLEPGSELGIAFIYIDEMTINRPFMAGIFGYQPCRFVNP